MRKRYSAAFKTQVFQELLRGEKTIAQIAAAHKVHPNLLSQWKAAALKGMPSLFDENRKAAAIKAEHESQLEKLYGQIGRLSTLTRAERAAMIERIDSKLTLSTQVELLGISRSSLYYHPVLPSPEEVRIKRLIDEIYIAQPYYGSRRIGAELERKGITIARKTVQKHMREMGIAAVFPVQT
ncbi:MAG: IS3 family transposase [Candidatus Eremiobacteraeota bacterium]|nr:IS3 family transposase [Candidatus Eremiobacteraeota bacterium]MBC5804794.1 IS3 family transposase [Candidatus Eremiobacteraeota bacterium]MBC5825042.1 IS3 family transposase [Candidatus Eremiobacteraeota bacterium]